MSRPTAIRLTIAILAVGFFVTPVAARMVGITAEAFENRRFAEAPKPSQGWDAFQQTSQFLIDRMPLRAQAVRANTRIWEDLFGTTPRYGQQTMLADDQALPFAGETEGDAATGQGAGQGPTTAAQVLSGQEGWLYLAGEQQNACEPPLPFDETLRRWAELVKAVRDSGRRAILIVAPDKASVYPEHLPDDFPAEECARKGKEDMWSLYEAIGPGLGIVPLRQRLLRAKERERDIVYLRKDSHWNAIGSLEMVHEVLARFGKGRVRVRPGDVKSSNVTYVGDLTQLLGAPENDTRPDRITSPGLGAPRIPGRAVLVGDSFSSLVYPQITPYFADLRRILWVGSTADQVRAEIAAADTVIFETVERDIGYRTADEGPASPAFTAALRQHLAR
jgi:alginate O-acetyltransferase complex protein AlgJ